MAKSDIGRKKDESACPPNQREAIRGAKGYPNANRYVER